jgi:hypothetical protein
MNKSHLYLLVSISLLALPRVDSQAQTANTISQKSTNADLPSFVTSGLSAYKAKGPDEAVKVWIAGSPIDGSTGALTQANNLRQIQDFYGAYKAYEYVSSRSISPSTQVFYLVMNFEKGPLFAKFVAYKISKDWILTSFDFNTKEEMIFPK